MFYTTVIIHFTVKKLQDLLNVYNALGIGKE